MRTAKRAALGLTLLEMAVVLTLTALTFPMVYRLATDFHRAWVAQQRQKNEWQQDFLFRQRLSLDLLRSGGVWEIRSESFRFVDSSGGLRRFPPEESVRESPFASLDENTAAWDLMEYRWDLDTGAAAEDPFRLDDFFDASSATEAAPDRVPEPDAWKRFDENGDGRVAGEELRGLRLFVLAWRPKERAENSLFSESSGPWDASAPKSPGHRRLSPAAWKVFYWFPRARLNPTLQPDDDPDWEGWP